MAFTPFEDAIKTYLDSAAEKDELFAKSYANPNKSIEECCKFIMGKAAKAAKRANGTQIACKDEEIYGLAMHYYDEEDIKVDPAPITAKVIHTPAKDLTPAQKKAKGKKSVKLAHVNSDYELDIPLF